METLRRTLEDAPVITRGKYEYFVHPVTDGIPLVEVKSLIDVEITEGQVVVHS